MCIKSSYANNPKVFFFFLDYLYIYRGIFGYMGVYKGLLYKYCHLLLFFFFSSSSNFCRYRVKTGILYKYTFISNIHRIVGQYNSNVYMLYIAFLLYFTYDFYVHLYNIYCIYKSLVHILFHLYIFVLYTIRTIFATIMA